MIQTCKLILKSRFYIYFYSCAHFVFFASRDLRELSIWTNNNNDYSKHKNSPIDSVCPSVRGIAAYEVTVVTMYMYMTLMTLTGDKILRHKYRSGLNSRKFLVMSFEKILIYSQLSHKKLAANRARICKRLRSRGIDAEDARICKRFRSPGIDSSSLCNVTGQYDK
jgi:hypothetical protein